MKLPFPDEAKVALEQTQGDMAAMREDIAEIRRLIQVLIEVQLRIAGLDKPDNL